MVTWARQVPASLPYPPTRYHGTTYMYPVNFTYLIETLLQSTMRNTSHIPHLLAIDIRYPSSTNSTTATPSIFTYSNHQYPHGSSSFRIEM